MSILTPGPDNMPVIINNGNTGIEGIELIRSGPGVAVWRVDTACKRNNSLVHGGPDRNTAEVWYFPQDSEGEYIEEPGDYAEYITKVHIYLPIEDATDHWVVDTRYDKYGGWIVAFLMPTMAELFTPEQIAMIRSPE